jgi:PHD/YefM family antitoxin component YafN of YafNO toxin-antitoxin module
MTSTTITKARSDLFNLISNVVNLNDVLKISTKDGNVVVMSEEDYNSLMETIYLCNQPGLVESILEAKNAPKEEFEEFDWRKELEK